MHRGAYGRVYKNKSITPELDKEKCAVCGFYNSVDLTEGEISLTNYITDTNETDDDGNDPITSIYTARSQCQLCGTPRTKTGRPGDLRRTRM